MCISFASLLVDTSGASADERGPHRLRLELDGAYSLRAGDDRDGLGFGGALEYEYIFGRRVGLGVRYESVAFPHDASVYVGNGFGVYHGIGPEVRLHLASNADRIDPWLAGGARIAFTGDLVRFGLQASVGLDILVNRAVSLGPTVSYIHVVQPNDAQDGRADGRVLTFGVALTWGNAADRDEDEDEPVSEVLEATDTTQSTPSPDSDEGSDTSSSDTSSDVPPVEDDTDSGEREARQPAARIDTDGDGVMDDDDACPDEPAPGGCPPPRLNELRVSDFDSDSASLNDAQIDQLRLVLDRLRSDQSIRRVQVIGHADRNGAESHNVRLSERRAATVVDWLVDHGIDRRRLQIVARGSTQPLIRDGSQEQLGTNRRVEFVIVDPPSSTD